jgi:hypothetical protein
VGSSIGFDVGNVTVVHVGDAVGKIEDAVVMGYDEDGAFGADGDLAQ